MMKNLFVTVLLSFFFWAVQAQTTEVHYLVKSQKQMTLDDGKTKEFMLEYEGVIYQSGAKVISLLKPQYLLEYPKGEIAMQTESGYSILSLNMDSVQNINLYHTDSLQYWYYSHTSESLPMNQYYTIKYKPGAMNWKLLPETKTINGLLCHHAVTYNGGDTSAILYDMWYHPDVSMGFGLLGLEDAPGLVVECTCPILNMSYSLKYFKNGDPANDAVFWPAVFNKVTFEDYTKSKKISEKDKKKSDIMNQQ
jgi:GLPGLI family protein